MKKKITMIVTIVMMVAMLVPACVFAAPQAQVKVLEPTVLKAGDYTVWPSGDHTIDRPLQIVMHFRAPETMESEYEEYITDFYLTVSGLKDGQEITADNCYLAGKYDSDGTYAGLGWVVIPTDGVKIKNGVEMPTVTTFDPNLTYEEICTVVKGFTAAIYIDEKIIEENPDIKVQLALKMTNPDDPTEVLTVGTPAVYDKYDLTGTERPAPPATEDSQKTEDKSPNTGDNNVAPFAAAGLALAAIATAVVVRRRYN